MFLHTNGSLLTHQVASSASLNNSAYKDHKSRCNIMGVYVCKSFPRVMYVQARNLPFSHLDSSSPHFPLNLTKCAYINTRQLHVAAAAARMCNAALSFNASYELYARTPSFLTAQSSHVKAGIAQSCKKISDLYLKDRDHLIDLDLLCDLDQYR